MCKYEQTCVLIEGEEGTRVKGRGIQGLDKL